MITTKAISKPSPTTIYRIYTRKVSLMEVLVKYENGYRFSATRGEYSVTAGRGDDGNNERDGM